MSNSNIFISNFVCVLTNKRYKTYQSGIKLLFSRLGHAPGVGLVGAGGGGGGGRVKNLSLGFAMAPHRLWALVFIVSKDLVNQNPRHFPCHFLAI